MIGAVARGLMPKPAKEWLKKRQRFSRLRATTRADDPSYSCPICGYRGPFLVLKESRSTLCPSCGSFPRHRLQTLVMTELLNDPNTNKGSMLHVAPEFFFSKMFASHFGKVDTADIDRDDVDYKEDLRRLSFPDASYDMVYASHVLEHIDDDEAAIKEVWRVLKPGGIAILPVPINAPKTVDYGAPNPSETDHVRCCGLDYFDRYRAVFDAVEVHGSDDYPAQHQLYKYETRDHYPTPESPLHPPMPGDKHPDAVPICRKAP